MPGSFRAGLIAVLDRVKPYRLPYVFALMVSDLKAALKLLAHDYTTDSGTSNAGVSLEQSIAYIEEVFNDYRSYGKIDGFHGAVAEIGPGDNAGVALLMRENGARKVDLVDRFYSKRDAVQQQKIYEKLSEKHDLSPFRKGESWDEEKILGVEWKTGAPAEQFFDPAQLGYHYDFIVSRSVMEHLYDPIGALELMIRSLKPGGKLVKKIDLRDHEMFTPEYGELTFLTISKFVYRRMTRFSGRPNRVLLNQYRNLLDRLKSAGEINYSIKVTRLVGVGEIVPHMDAGEIDPKDLECARKIVESHRPQLAEEFSELNSFDLAVAGFFLVVEKS